MIGVLSIMLLDEGEALYPLAHLVAYFALMADSEHHDDVRFNAIAG